MNEFSGMSRRVPCWVPVILLAFSMPVAPATIDVNNRCTLPLAIIAANTDGDSGGVCLPGGSGADTDG